MEKETEYSFIVEFDEMTDKQINNLTDYFGNNKIKFHVIKSDYELKKQKEINKKAVEYIKEKQKIQYKFALSHIECDDLLQILEDKEVQE